MEDGNVAVLLIDKISPVFGKENDDIDNTDTTGDNIAAIVTFTNITLRKHLRIMSYSTVFDNPSARP